MKSTFRGLIFLFTAILCLLAFGLSYTSSIQAAQVAFAQGDVFVAVSNGQVQWYRADGTLNQTLSTSVNGFTTGMAFDATGNLYVTGFSGQLVSKFDSAGNLLGTFGSGFDTSPESIVFDAVGNAYVGHADSSHAIRKFDPSGNFVAAFQVQVERRGTDWIDLADDQCTMYYTSEGPSVMRYNVCTNTQLPNFNAVPLPNGIAFALRILSTGGVMVANSTTIVRLDTSGNLIQTYDVPGQDCWFALNLDPDAKSFWSADFCTSNVYKFDLTTGNVLKTFNSGTGGNTVFGLAIKGERTAAQPCTLPAFGDANGNPIRQNTQELRQVGYGGHEFNLPGRGQVFLPFRSGELDNSIARWGCYLSSGAMTINYFATQQGIAHRTDPATLNEWMAHNLTNSNSGYASGSPLDDSGNENWQNPTHVVDAGVDPTTLVQYATAHGIDMAVTENRFGRNQTHDDLLNQAMCDLNPAILAVNNTGHWISASGKMNVRNIDTWRLHDPLQSAPTNLLDAYSNSYSRLIIFNGDKPRSALLLSLYSPAEMVVTDSQGHRTGLDPRTGTIYEEIPSASYGQEFLAADDGTPEILERKVFYIDSPISGLYTVTVIGTGNGAIGLDVVPIDTNGNGPRITTGDIVAPGVANTYRLTYSSTPNEPTEFVRLTPTANAGGPYSGVVAELILFDASKSYDSDGRIALYEWDFEGDGAFDVGSPDPTVAHTYSAVFSGTVTLRVTDNDGNMATNMAQVQIRDIPHNIISISSNKNGSVPRLSYRDEDIIANDLVSNTWSLIFDGSDVGLGNVDVDAFAFLPNGHLLLSVDTDFKLNGFGSVDDSDILEFIPLELGNTTRGSYKLYFDGSDVGLSNSGEDIDAIDFDKDGNLVISVNGEFKAPGVSGNIRGNDEDLFALKNGIFGTASSGTWSLYFDGSDVGLTSSNEDLQALWMDHANSKLYFATLEDYSLLGGLKGNEDDIIVCAYSSLGDITACTFERFWDGDKDHNFDEDAIDGLSIGTLPIVHAANDIQGVVAVDDTVESVGDDADDADELDGEEAPEANNQIFLPLINR